MGLAQKCSGRRNSFIEPSSVFKLFFTYGLTSHIFWTYQLPPTPSILFQRLLEEYLGSDTQNMAFIVSIGPPWTMSPAVKGSPVVCTRYLDVSLAPRKTIVCSLCRDSSSVFLILNVMYNWLYSWKSSDFYNLISRGCIPLWSVWISHNFWTSRCSSESIHVLEYLVFTGILQRLLPW